ncbi:MAG TPA: M15 family metallopeptidase [Nocardioidaceae bacterium]|nr:M15 family metallopeptidase [Nocardioidaceae bacterium]
MTAARSDVTVAAGQQNATTDPAATVSGPGRLVGPVQAVDLLVVGRDTIPRRVREQVARAPGVDAVEPLAMASAPVGGRVITIGAVDPSSYRRFTPTVSARSDAVWARVSEGDLAMSPELAEDLDQALGGDMTLGNQAGALTLRVGAQASMPPKIDAVVNPARGRQLGMVPDNAILVSIDGSGARTVAEDLRRRVGSKATVTSLTETAPPEGRQTAFLTGGSVAEAVGTFSYRYHQDGSVDPDPAWVAANLRTETVPIVGQVTCHRVMLPQLRGALQEVVDSGLADRIDPADFGGCYAPRFIAGDPTKGLSLHTWGIAVDLNVHSNQRGTPGRIDRRVVDIFERWGFAWGGDWSYTDPMHFELAAIVRPR